MDECSDPHGMQSILIIDDDMAIGTLEQEVLNKRAGEVKYYETYRCIRSFPQLLNPHPARSQYPIDKPWKQRYNSF